MTTRHTIIVALQLQYKRITHRRFCSYEVLESRALGSLSNTMAQHRTLICPYCSWPPPLLLGVVCITYCNAVQQMHLMTSGSFLCPGMTFGWEFFLSFILVATVYATAIGAPNFGKQLAHLHVIIMLFVYHKITS